MSYEENLRRQLQQSAAALDLPERNPSTAMRRSQRRRQTRRALIAVTAVVAVLAIGTPFVLQDDKAGTNNVEAGAAKELVPTGPLNIDWSTAEGGLSSYSIGSLNPWAEANGTVYSLSTGPGMTYDDCPDLDCTRAIYRLNEDGTWAPVVLDGDRPNAHDIAASEDLVFATSTGVVAGDDMFVRLSSSSDDGNSWTNKELAPVDPPSDHNWTRSATAVVENNGTDTIALVRTQFKADEEALFPELASNQGYWVEYAEEGVQLMGGGEGIPQLPQDPDGGDDWSSQLPQDPAPTTTVPAGEAADPGSGQAANPDAAGEAGEEAPVMEEEVVDTVPWSELGVDSRSAAGPVYQVLRHTGEGWEELDNDLPAEASEIHDLQSVGGRFITLSWTLGGGNSLFASQDGAHWTKLEVPLAEGEVFQAGDALVNVPVNSPDVSTEAHVSTDGGASWQPLSLDALELKEGESIVEADGGPLGLVLVIADADGVQRLAISGDLIDWTITPLTDLIEGIEPWTTVQPFVGSDKIVFSAVTDVAGSPPLPSKTVIGTPQR